MYAYMLDDGWMEGWMDGWMDEWMDGRMDDTAVCRSERGPLGTGTPPVAPLM